MGKPAAGGAAVPSAQDRERGRLSAEGLKDQVEVVMRAAFRLPAKEGMAKLEKSRRNGWRGSTRATRRVCARAWRGCSRFRLSA